MQGKHLKTPIVASKSATENSRAKIFTVLIVFSKLVGAKLVGGKLVGAKLVGAKLCKKKGHGKILCM
jgi:hypothetical protein